MIGFEAELAAFEPRSELLKRKKPTLIKMEAGVLVGKDPKGEVKLHQAVTLIAAGAVG